MSEWISVKDRMPIGRQVVDLWATGEPLDIAFYCAPYKAASAGRVTACWWNKKNNGWRVFGGLTGALYLTVTHWRPAPEPPTVSEPESNKEIR